LFDCFALSKLSLYQLIGDFQDEGRESDILHQPVASPQSAHVPFRSLHAFAYFPLWTRKHPCLPSLIANIH
jgi:hypothetical protein